ncbi:MAG: NAD-dependent epimerase/dehydratase family protein [Bacteroidales bacterium]
MKKTAVVFGATGLVGKELVKALLDNNLYGKIIIVARKTLPIVDQKLEQLLLDDFSDLVNYHNRLKANEFFCCIGTTIKTAGSQEAFRKVDFEIPVQVAKLAQELRIQNLVIISSIGADAKTGNFYLRTKGEMEHAVKEAYKGNLKIVRPSLLIGDRREFRFGERVAVFIMKLLGWLFVGPLKRFRGIKARAVANAMIRVTQLPVEKIIIESDELYDYQIS